MTQKSKFLTGAFVLGVSGLLVKVLGVFFRIPLNNAAGAEGMSYYSSVYPVYGMLLVLSTSGIPVAISRLVSENITVRNYAGAHKIFKISLGLMAVIGGVSFGLVLLGNDYIAKVLLSNDGAQASLIAIAPSLFFVPVLSAMRGYFQGRQNMNPTAISELVEQLARVVVGVSLALYLLKTSGFENFCAGATFGCTAGSIAGLATIASIYFLSRKAIKHRIRVNERYSHTEPAGAIIKKILVISIPITIGASILPLMSGIDATLVIRRLESCGFTMREAKTLFSLFSNYCIPIIGLPLAITAAVVISIVPAVAACNKVKNLGDVRKTTDFGLRVTMMVAFPCTFGIFALSEPILKLLYPGQTEDAMAAAGIMRLMSFYVILIAAQQLLSGALQGIGRQNAPVKFIAIGALLKLAVTYIFVGIKAVNIYGAVMGSIFAYGIATVLCLRELYKVIDLKLNYMESLVKPLIVSVLMGVAAFATYKLMSMVTGNAVSTAAAIFAGVIAYGVLVINTKMVTKEEIMLLPKGEKIAALLGRFMKL